MKHYIIIKFNDQIKMKDIINPIKSLFNEALNIDGIFKIDIMESNCNLPNRHDLMIVMHLTKDALINFDNSHIHKSWKENYGKYIMNKTIFDCD